MVVLCSFVVSWISTDLSSPGINSLTHAKSAYNKGRLLEVSIGSTSYFSKLSSWPLTLLSAPLSYVACVFPPKAARLFIIARTGFKQTTTSQGATLIHTSLTYLWKKNFPMLSPLSLWSPITISTFNFCNLFFTFFLNALVKVKFRKPCDSSLLPWLPGNDSVASRFGEERLRSCDQMRDVTMWVSWESMSRQVTRTPPFAPFSQLLAPLKMKKTTQSK